MPPQIRSLRNEAFSYAPSNSAWEFQKVIDELTTFFASVRSGQLTDKSVIIPAAMRIDTTLINIMANVPSDWVYETVYTSTNPDIVWNGRYDIYYCNWIAQFWNGIRSTRILLNEIIRSHLLDAFTADPPQLTEVQYTTQYQLSIDTIIAMRDEVLHSIPQHLGFVNRKPFQNLAAMNEACGGLEDTNVSATEPLARNEMLRFSPHPEQVDVPLYHDESAPARGGYVLLWPLCTFTITSSFHFYIQIPIIDFLPLIRYPCPQTPY
jgi:hypothetical protein